MFKDFGFQLSGRPKYGIAGHIGLARGISTGIKRCHIRILGGHDVNILKGNANRLSRHLSHNGIQALTDFGGAHLNMQGSVLVENDAGSGNLQADRIGPGGITETGNTESATHRTGLLLRPGCTLFIPANQILAPLKAFDQSAAFKSLTGQRVRIALPGHIFDPELHRIHADFARRLFDDALHRKYHLRCSVSPHGAGRGHICVNGSGMVMHGRAGIKGTGFSAGGTGHRVPVRGISTGIGHGIHVQCHQCPVFVYAGPHFDFKRVPGSGSDHALFPGKIYLYRPSSQFQG